MMDSETAILEASVTTMRQALGYTQAQCEVEFDQIPPATVGDFYVAVIPGGWRAGPRNNTCGGILDEVIDINVCVIRRAPRFPRDRSRSLLFDALSGINKQHRQILASFGQFNYPMMNLANTLLDKNPSGNVEGFIEPLRFIGMIDPKEVGGDYFAAQSDESFAGLVRVARYGGARRIQHIATGLT